MNTQIRLAPASGCYQRENPKRSTPWVAFPEHGGFYRLLKGTLEFAPDRDERPSLTERCEVDFNSMDAADEPAARLIFRILAEEPFCRRCENPGSRCACDAGDFE